MQIPPSRACASGFVEAENINLRQLPTKGMGIKTPVNKTMERKSLMPQNHHSQLFALHHCCLPPSRVSLGDVDLQGEEGGRTNAVIKRTYPCPTDNS
jgi:hypothetical protein